MLPLSELGVRRILAVVLLLSLAASPISTGVLRTEGGLRYEYWISWGSKGNGLGQYNRPTGIELYRDRLGIQNLLVADTDNHRVKSLSSIGTFNDKWGAQGKGALEFERPTDIALDSKGDLLAVDSGNNRIHKILIWVSGLNEIPGTELAVPECQAPDVGSFGHPQAIAIDRVDIVYIADTDNHRILKFSPTWELLASIGREGLRPGEFNHPSGVAVDRHSNLYVADTKNHRVQKFDSSGQLLACWGGFGRKTSLFNEPMGIDIGPGGRVYVADSGNHRIQIFDDSGTLLAYFGSHGAGLGSLDTPLGVAVDNDRFVYLTDSGNNRIQVFRPVMKTSPD